MYMKFLMYVAASHPRVHQHRRTAERWEIFVSEREKCREMIQLSILFTVDSISSKLGSSRSRLVHSKNLESFSLV